MQNTTSRFLNLATIVIAVCFVAAVMSHAQPAANQSGNAPRNNPPANSAATENAEREQIWNSPQMLRARAWLQDYCSKSRKVTPEMARKYMQELESLSPTQMKLWLLKFDEQEEQRQQQYAFWQHGNAIAVQHAQAMSRQTQENLNAINKAQSESAQMEQQQIEQQREQAEQIGADKQLGPYGSYPYGPWGGGYGGYHVHYHLYGSPFGYPY
jgi:hypothetical protein